MEKLYVVLKALFLVQQLSLASIFPETGNNSRPVRLTLLLL